MPTSAEVVLLRTDRDTVRDCEMKAGLRIVGRSFISGVAFLLCIGSWIVCLAKDVQVQPTSASSAQIQRGPEVHFSDGLLSVVARDVDIRKLVEAIASKSGVEIVLDEGIIGKVTADFKALMFEEGLKTVLRDVVEGGFVSEFVRKTDAGGIPSLRKVVIAPRTGLPKPEFLKAIANTDVLWIDEMYIGEAKGEEVLFVPWGEGEGQIPLRVVVVDGQEERLGFDLFRVGEDGAMYFVGWGHKKLWVYDRDGSLRHAINLTLAKFGGDTFDVDHEGNVHVLSQQGRKDDLLMNDIRVYDSGGKEVARVSASAGRAGGGPCAVVVDGLLVNLCESGRVIADFRHLLRDPNSRSRRFKNFRYGIQGSVAVSDPLGPAKPGIGTHLLRSVRRLGIPQDVISAPFPEEWAYRVSRLGYQEPILYELVEVPAPGRRHGDFAFAVLDLHKKRASYYWISQRDTFVSETQGYDPGPLRFDIDLDGNAYQLFTSERGIHIYRYTLEDVR